jgi:hypothetical protein
VNAANNASASALEEEPLHERIKSLEALGLTAVYRNISNNNKQSTLQR